jgi:hypothetical protein
VCNFLRKEDDKKLIKEAKILYNNRNKINDYVTPHINTQEQKLNTLEQSRNSIINYVFTLDKYYEVIINPGNDMKKDVIDHLKHVFIDLMCGSFAKNFFPNEKKYSSSVIFPVSAALYSIKFNNNIPYIHGFLRYKTNKNDIATMTINKLIHINKTIKSNKKTIIEVKNIDLWEDKKHHYSFNAIDLIIKNINESVSYGSTLNDFL